MEKTKEEVKKDITYKVKPRGKPIPYIMYCPKCSKHSFFPEEKIDFDNPPKGWICTYCKQKYRMKFNGLKWEFTMEKE